MRYCDLNEIIAAKCVHPLHLPSVDINLRVNLDNDSALIGTNASFTCPSGRLLIGSSKATCMGNGIWEPDPRENQCKSKHNSYDIPNLTQYIFVILMTFII